MCPLLPASDREHRSSPGHPTASITPRQDSHQGCQISRYKAVPEPTRSPQVVLVWWDPKMLFHQTEKIGLGGGGYKDVGTEGPEQFGQGK